jgi:hypothetical protein
MHSCQYKCKVSLSSPLHLGLPNGVFLSGLTNFMEQSPHSHSAGQQILRLLWNPRIHYSVHNSPPLVPILIQMNPAHNFSTYFPKIPVL